MAFGGARALCAGLMVVMGSVMVPPPSALAQDDETGADVPSSRPGAAPRGIEEIIVKARKRAELLEDVPLSVTVVDTGELRASGATRLDDIQILVPNLQFRRSGIAPAAPIFIRGIGQQDEALAFDQGVGVYVDGVQLSRSIGLLLDLVDVQQIEVLRGPQGTLFGRNVVGGAINVSTVRPQEELGGSLFVRAGNFDAVETRATLNAPLGTGNGADVLFSRFTFLGKTARGYVDNTYRDENLSDDDGVGFLGSLRWLPLEGLTIDVSGAWERSHRRGVGGQCVPVQKALDPVVRFLADTFYPGYQESCAEQDPFHVRSDAFALADLQSYGAWGTASWDFGSVGWLEDLTVKSITGWREQRTRYRIDTDFQEFPIIVSAHIGGDDPSGAEGEPVFAQQISEEVQAGMRAADGRLNAVAGAFFFSDEANDTGGQSAFRDRADGSPGVGNGTSVSRVSIDNFSWALFAQATYDLFDWASLTAGVRYTKERKQLAKREVFPLLSDLPRVDAAEEKEFVQWTPTASLALHVPDPWMERTPLDRVMGYFTYSRGFKGGGFNAVAGSQVPEGETATDLEPFRPEHVDSFEIGFKSFAFARRLSLNVAFFLADYQDIQVVLAKLDSTSEDTLPSYLRVVDNAARATVRGVEIEAAAHPLWDLELSGSVGLLDAEYDEFEDAPSDLDSVPIDRSGESFPNVPDLQTHVAVQYPVAVAPGPRRAAGTLTPRLDWYYQSEVHYAGPELKALVQRGYHLLDARLSYELWDEHLELALWAKNLLDETYFSGGAAFATLQGNAFRFTAPPRTFGGEVRLTF
jgi:iron complex outermembrane receptor protein